MGRGTSKASGGSRSTSGGKESLTGATSGLMKAEETIYDMPKKSTQKAVKAALDEAPAGTVVAYKYGSSDKTIIFEKMDRQGAFGDIWMKTEMDEVGVSTGYATNMTISVKDMLNSSNVTKGLTDTQRKRYKTAFNSLKKQYGF